jgi:hypothetical protein
MQGLARLEVIFEDKFHALLILAASQVTLMDVSIDTADRRGWPFDSVFTGPAYANHEVRTMLVRTAEAGP